MVLPRGASRRRQPGGSDDGRQAQRIDDQPQQQIDDDQRDDLQQHEQVEGNLGAPGRYHPEHVTVGQPAEQRGTDCQRRQGQHP